MMKEKFASKMILRGIPFDIALSLADELIELLPYPLNPAKGKRETSAEAAEKIKMGDLHRTVLYCLQDYGPQTMESIAQRTNIPECTVQPRTSEMALMGLIQAQEKKGKNKRGNSVIIWEIVR